MAMFCLLLAAAAFVLTGGLRGCRCDRPERDHEWYRAASGFDGAVWRQDESNSIPITKLTLARSRYYPAAAAAIAFRGSSTPPELLLNRYRKYMVDTFVRFDDACSSDDEEDDSHNSDGPGGPSTARSDVSERSSTPPDDAGTRETAGDAKRSNTPWAETMKLPVDGEWCSKSAKNFYRCLHDRLDDQQLVAMIDSYIEANCYRSETDAADTDDGGGPGNTFPEKRDWPKYVSKQKFHSWGGKRNAGQVFYPWGGKRTAVPRAHKQPKVVIRNPFHSWGGKRSDLAVAVMA